MTIYSDYLTRLFHNNTSDLGICTLLPLGEGQGVKDCDLFAPGEKEHKKGA